MGSHFHPQVPGLIERLIKPWDLGVGVEMLAPRKGEKIKSIHFKIFSALREDVRAVFNVTWCS